VTASRPTVDRRTYIGGSSIGAVVGLHPYKTSLDVWGEIVHGVAPEVGPAAEVGLVLEEPVAHLYATRMLQDHGACFSVGTMRDRSCTWAAATPDRVVWHGGPTVRNVQIKVVGLAQQWRWGEPEQGPEGVPPEVLAQVTWEARAIERGWTVAGAPINVECPESHVVALIGTELRVFAVPTDRELMDLLFEAAGDFWRDHVETGRPPEITEENASAARELVGRRYPRERLPMVPATDELVRLAREYDVARAEAEAAEARKDAAYARLAGAIGDAEGFAADDGAVRVTFKANASGGPDWKAIALARGATDADQKLYQRKAARVLRVTVG
jgi:predicted phage-related endonuclease